MRKKDYELIAQTIASEARSKLEVYRMLSTPSNQKRGYPGRRAEIAQELQVLWSLTLELSERLRYTSRGFDANKFCEMATTSPQNWRYMEWVDGKWVNTFDAEKELNTMLEVK